MDYYQFLIELCKFGCKIVNSDTINDFLPKIFIDNTPECIFINNRHFVNFLNTRNGKFVFVNVFGLISIDTRDAIIVSIKKTKYHVYPYTKSNRVYSQYKYEIRRYYQNKESSSSFRIKRNQPPYSENAINSIISYLYTNTYNYPLLSNIDNYVDTSLFVSHIYEKWIRRNLCLYKYFSDKYLVMDIMLIIINNIWLYKCKTIIKTPKRLQNDSRNVLPND